MAKYEDLDLIECNGCGETVECIPLNGDYCADCFKEISYRTSEKGDEIQSAAYQFSFAAGMGCCLENSRQPIDPIEELRQKYNIDVSPSNIEEDPFDLGDDID